jgi:hypothetical protein
VASFSKKKRNDRELISGTSTICLFLPRLDVVMTFTFSYLRGERYHCSHTVSRLIIAYAILLT